MEYKITLTVWLHADDDGEATGIIDKAFEESDDEPRIKAWHFDAVETDQ